MKSIAIAAASLITIASAAPVNVGCPSPTAVCADKGFSFSGSNWQTNSNQDSRVAPCDQTLLYSNDPNACYTFSWNGLGNMPSGFVVYGGQKLDRGAFNVFNVAADGTNYHIGSGNAYANTNGIEPGDLGTASAPLYTSDPIPHLTNMVFRVCNAQPGSYLLAEHIDWTYQ